MMDKHELNQPAPPTLANITDKFHWYHWLVLLASFLLTLAAWFVSSEQSHQKMEQQYKFQASHLIELVEERMNRYEDTLWGSVAALKFSDGEINAKQWKSYSEQLSLASKYPGINGIGVIYYVKPEGLSSFITRQQRDQTDFRVHPPHNKQEFWPITFIEPLESNRKALGLDMAHETNRLTAAKKARDSGLAQITAPIVLVQDSQKTPGFLFYAPFYKTENIPDTLDKRRANFIGNVYAPFIMKNLMDGTLENENRLLNFSIRDGNYLLYDELSADSTDFDPDPIFSEQHKINLYGRTWDFKIQTSLLFRSQHNNNQPIIILLAGIAIEIMLFSLFLILVNANHRAVSYAKTVSKDLIQKQEELTGAYTRMSRAFDTMLDGLVIVSNTGIILEVNNATLMLFHYHRDELVGQNIHCLLPTSSNDESENANPLLTVGEQRIMGKRKNNSQLPIHVQISEDLENNQPIFIGIIHDLTDKHQDEQRLAEQEALLTTAIHSSLSGFALCDVACNFTEINAGLAEWLGYSTEELIGQPVSTIIADHEKVQTQHGLDMLIKGDIESIRREKQYKRVDGSLVWGLLSSSSIRNSAGQVTSIFAQILDIDRAKRLSLQLETRNAELVRSNAELDQFAYVASHDLKAPLNAINKLAGWIEEDCEGILPESAQQHFELLKNRSKRMGKLLDDLLLFSRVGRVNYQVESVGLRPLVLDIVGLMDIPSTFNVTVADITLNVAKTPFEQVIRNLIGNAVKHHPNDAGNIAVLAEKTVNGFTLKVADDGTGIPPNLHDKALEMFQTLRPRDEVEGSGLGLALCNKIVEYNGGSLHIESTNPEFLDKPNQLSADNLGTTIVIFLPIKQNMTD
ncbi:CHASE domain-containing protein [Neptunomonas phycophila]|uniref:histidine kinase n=1 Tax=Neptunomonas phycophila TaxID=1572645 RepID=A0AAW7XJ88_9GAMM|nr:CHASE domain-containing protein [Neptunomonas phycophila]MDO6454262.1 CHASE domain-containing protein [Neptunomonas phycophila]